MNRLVLPGLNLELELIVPAYKITLTLEKRCSVRSEMAEQGDRKVCARNSFYLLDFIIQRLCARHSVVCGNVSYMVEISRL